MSTRYICFYGELRKTRAVRGSDYSPTLALSEEKDKIYETSSGQRMSKFTQVKICKKKN